SGRLIKVDPLYLVLETNIAGVIRNKTIFNTDIKSMKTVTADSADATLKEARAKRDAKATGDSAAPRDASGRELGVILLPMEGGVGEGFRHEEIAEAGFGFRLIDHIVGNVEEGKMDAWRDWYEKVLGWHQHLSFDDKDISTEYTALRSKVMSNDKGNIRFPINEPAQGKKKSQIDEYLDFNEGPGSQHIALLTTDIIDTVTKLRATGIEFLEVPRTYYDTLADRVGEIEEDIETLAKLGILVDRDDNGYLLQLFTTPVEDRPTLSYEIIQRKGSNSFGKGNFQALFESIEREQANRGTL
ncbi:MAG: 4-hydroxyphenylpyruvate dioxygenase, partial [bacterium]|nr:4-hydroxyphenylpyruvate dioxygenase [bacterium]